MKGTNLSTQTTATAPGPPSGVLVRWLRNPNAFNHNAGRAIGDRLSSIPLLVIPSVVGSCVLVALGCMWFRNRRARLMTVDARLLSISLPAEVDSSGAVVFWKNLHDLIRPAWQRFWHGQPHVSFEYVWHGPTLGIQLWVPSQVPQHLVERATQAAWPGAVVRVGELRSEAGSDSTVGGSLKLAGPEWFPLAVDHDADPLRSLFGALSELRADQTAWVQILARPATAARTAKCLRAASALRQGRALSRGIRLLDLLTPGVKSSTATSDDPTRNDKVRVVVAKASEMGWECAVRYGISAFGSTPATKNELVGRAHAAASSFAIFSGHNRLRRRKLRRVVRVLRERRLGRGDLLSTSELAALAHLPTDRLLPGVERAPARCVAPVARVAEVGKVLGDADAGVKRPIAIAGADAPYHLHVLGSTGSGKSTLLTNLVLGDVAAGRGAVVIDPKGDLITDIMDRLEVRYADRVILLDPSEQAIAPSLDVLSGDDVNLAVDNVVGIFRKIYEAYWGPRTDDVLRAACLTLRTKSDASLAEIPLLFSDERFRHQLTATLNDDVGLGGFWKWYEALGETQQTQVVGPLISKLRAFLLRDFVRTVVSPGPRSLHLDEVLDSKLLLVRLPKGIIGSETAKLLGSLVVARVWQTALARIQAKPGSRLGTTLYIDECHNFLNMPGSVDEMLAEARGYGLSMVLAHQHLGQLSRELRDAVSANARNKVFFSMSPEDARVLERHVQPELSAHDLGHLDGYQVAARLVAGGRDAPACTVATRPAPPVIELGACGLRQRLRARRNESQRGDVARPGSVIDATLRKKR